MSLQPTRAGGRPGFATLSLDYPISLGVFEKYEDAQKAVDTLSDKDFPVQNVLIVGTDLKQMERVTARLTWGRVLLGGLLSGVWLGVFVGLIISLFGRPESTFGLLLFAALWGGLFGVVWAAAGYAFTRGQRDFSSVTQVVATRYEVFCEHKFAQQGRGILAEAGLSSTAAPTSSPTTAPTAPADPYRPPGV
jgi:hypothetical protein